MELLTLEERVGSVLTVSGSAAQAQTHFINSFMLGCLTDMFSFDPVVSDVSFVCFDRGQITGLANICI